MTLHQVLLRLTLECVGTTGIAEVVGVTSETARGGRRGFVNGHVADGIDRGLARLFPGLDGERLCVEDQPNRGDLAFLQMIPFGDRDRARIGLDHEVVEDAYV